MHVDWQKSIFYESRILSIDKFCYLLNKGDNDFIIAIFMIFNRRLTLTVTTKFTFKLNAKRILKKKNVLTDKIVKLIVRSFDDLFLRYAFDILNNRDDANEMKI